MLQAQFKMIVNLVQLYGFLLRLYIVELLECALRLIDLSLFQVNKTSVQYLFKNKSI